MALYRSPGDKFRLRLFLPEKIAAGWDSGVVVTRVSHDMWRLNSSPDPDFPKIRQDGKIYQIDAGYAKALTSGFTEPFGASPAEYVQDDEGITVRLLTDQLRPVASRAPKIYKPKAAKPVAEEPIISQVARAVDPRRSFEDQLARDAATDHEPRPSDPRSILQAIAEVERSTPYRLVRLKDGAGWAWQAPTIRLGGC
jgi:hypothetical protein